MTPERIAELRTRYPSLKFVAELADEIDRLTDELAERENDIPARLTAEMERDDARAVAGRLFADIELWVGFDAIRTLNLAAQPAWLAEWARRTGPTDEKRH